MRYSTRRSAFAVLSLTCASVVSTAQNRAPVVEPIVFTNEALERAGKTYEELWDAFEVSFGTEPCVGLRIHSVGGGLEEWEVDGFVDAVNQKLATALESGEIKRIHVDTLLFDDLSPATRRTPNAASGWLVDRAEVTPSATTGALDVYIGKGTLSQAAAVEFSAEQPALLLGLDVVRERRVGYLIHLLGNLAGLRPVWGAGEHCADDGVWDTPLHAAPNYDCRSGHRANCGPNWELDANLMDARYCGDSLALSFTSVQRLTLLRGLSLDGVAGSCREKPGPGASAMPESRLSAPETSCEFVLTPNPVDAGSGCQLRLVVRDDVELSDDISVVVTKGARVAARYTIAREEAGASELAIPNSCNLDAGAYTVTIGHGAIRCTQVLVVAE